MPSEEEQRKFTEALTKSITKTFMDMPTPEAVIDAIQINIDLYKAKKTNPLHFSIILGIASAAFMDKMRDEADREDKILQAQPNPGLN